VDAHPKKGSEVVMTTLVKRFVAEEQGLETVEYAVLAALIIIAVVGAIATLGTAIKGQFTNVAGTVTSP
jgi:Flp pilus assembly pilin Flp